jgi:hypothetical protein
VLTEQESWSIPEPVLTPWSIQEDQSLPEVRSQWPRNLRHELSSLARTLGSWVRIPFEAWIPVSVYFVFVLGSGLSTGWSLVHGVLPTVLD